MRSLASRSPRAFARASRRFVPLLLATALLAPSRGASAAPGGADGRWRSSDKGLAVQGVSSVRVTSKQEVWYASIFGPKKTRGLCESTSKGAKPWTVRTTGLEQSGSGRDTWRITIDPKDDKTIYAVAGGKIFKSVNAAASWEFAGNGTVTFSFDRSQSRSLIEGVEVDPSNSKRLLAGTLARGYFGGLFESKDAGKSWTQLAGTGERTDLTQSGLGGDAWPIALDKGSDKYILVGGTAGSAWLSQNRGTSFKSTQPGGPGVHRAYAMTPMVNREVYLAESRGLWRSRDAGESWGKAPILPGTCISVDVDDGNRKVVYAILEGKGLHRTDNVTTWTGPLHPEIDAHEVYCHPHAKNTILISSRTTGLWISTDKGETVTQPAEHLPDVVPAITCVAVHPANPTAWLASTDTGTIFGSGDRGATWTKVGNLAVPVTKLLADPSSPSAWIAIGPGVYASTDGGAKWSALYLPPDAEERVAALERLADGTWLALLEREGRVVASHDGGKTWDKDAFKRPAGTKTAWGAALAVDAKDAKHLLVAMRTTAETWSKDDKEGGPYESKDGGATWTALENGFKSDKGVAREWWNRGAVCAIDPNHGTLFYGADGAGLFRLEPTADGKPGTWEEAALTGAPAQPTFNAFLMTPTTADTSISTTIVTQLEGSTTRALLQSIDGGKTFSALPDPGTRLASLSEDPASPGRWVTGDPVGDRGVLTFDPSAGVAPLTAPVAPTPVQPKAPEPPPVAPSGLVAFTGGKDKVLRIVDLHDGQAKPASPAFGGEVLCVALSGDEKRLFAGGADKVVSVFDGGTAEPKGRLEGAAGAVQSIAVSPDGATVYAGDQAFGITIFGVADGKAAGKLEGHTGAVNALALSKDGARLYSGSSDRSVRVWDVAAKKELLAIPGHPGEVFAVALSPDGTKVYVGGRDASIRVYDAATGAPFATWASPVPAVEALVASPEGSLLYVVGGAGKEVHALGTADGQTSFVYTGSPTPLTCAALSLDGEWIAAGGEDGQLRTWKKGRADVVWTSTKLHEGAVRCVALTPDVVAKPGAPADATPPAPAAPGMDATPAPGMDAPPAPGMDAPAAPGMDAPPAPGMDAPPGPAAPVKPSDPSMK